MAINYRDPRYQKEVLSATASPLANKTAAQEETTAEFVAQQENEKGKFARLGLEKKMFEGNLSLANERLKFQKDSFYDGLDNAEEATKLGMYGGLGTTLLAGYIGRQRQNTLEKEAAQRQKILDNLLSAYGNNEGAL